MSAKAELPCAISNIEGQIPFLLKPEKGNSSSLHLLDPGDDLMV